MTRRFLGPASVGAAAMLLIARSRYPPCVAVVWRRRSSFKRAPAAAALLRRSGESGEKCGGPGREETRGERTRDEGQLSWFFFKRLLSFGRVSGRGKFCFFVCCHSGFFLVHKPKRISKREIRRPRSVGINTESTDHVVIGGKKKKLLAARFAAELASDWELRTGLLFITLFTPLVRTRPRSNGGAASFFFFFFRVGGRKATTLSRGSSAQSSMLGHRSQIRSLARRYYSRRTASASGLDKLVQILISTARTVYSYFLYHNGALC